MQFNQPVSEAAASAIGAVANYLLQIQLPVGSVFPSMLTEPQLQALLNNPNPSTWVVADGRDVTGSQFQFVTGMTNIPDLRGIFVRGLNNGGSAAGTRSDSYANPNDPSGTFTPGTLALDAVGPHYHNYATQRRNADGSAIADVWFTNSSLGSNTYSTDQGSATPQGSVLVETAPKNASLIWFIRIN